MLLPHLAEDPEAARIFASEAELFAAIDSPHVPRLLDTGTWLGAPWFALEHAGDVTLRAFLDRLRGAPVSSRLAAAVGFQIARALRALHTSRSGGARGFVHRDLTPANVVLGSGGLVRLIDLGLTRPIGAASRTETGIVKGKHAYLSPEQIRRAPVDARTDLHALGAILRELVTGVPAYRGDDILDTFERIVERRLTPARAPAIAPRLSALIDACLATDPADRPASAAAVEEALAALLGDPDPTTAALAVVAEGVSQLVATPPGVSI